MHWLCASFGLTHATGVVRADDAGGADRAEVRVHVYFREQSTEPVGRVRLLFIARLGAALGVELREPRLAEQAHRVIGGSPAFFSGEVVQFGSQRLAGGAPPRCRCSPSWWSRRAPSLSERSVSPNSKRTRSSGRPSVSAATCVADVYVPGPISLVALRTTTVPSANSVAEAWVA